MQCWLLHGPPRTAHARCTELSSRERVRRLRRCEGVRSESGDRESGDCDGARESGASQEQRVRRQRVEISGDTLRGGGSSTSGGRDGQDVALDIWDIGRKRDI